MSDWWNTFFDDDYFMMWEQSLSEAQSTKQAADLWSMLDPTSGYRILDALCGWGRLAEAGARLAVVAIREG